MPRKNAAKQVAETAASTREPRAKPKPAEVEVKPLPPNKRGRKPAHKVVKKNSAKSAKGAASTAPTKRGRGRKPKMVEYEGSPKLPRGAPKPTMLMNEELKNEGLEYEVEEIVASRMALKDKREYLVKWVGWGKKHNTWEPEANLRNAFDKITEFDAKNPDAP